MNYIYKIKTQQHRNLRRILSYASLVLFLVCLANTAAAQSSVTVSLLPSSESVWQNTTAATVYEGEKVQFIVQLSRTLNNNESVTVPLEISAINFTRSASDLASFTTRLVSGANVSLTSSAGANPSITFRRGGRAATLELSVPNPPDVSRIDGGIRIMLENITGTDVTAVADTDSLALALRILLDEFAVCFSESNYTIREGDDTQMNLQISRGTDDDRTSGLREDITVTFTYLLTPPSPGLPQYEPFSNVTIPAGQPNVMLPSPILDDDVIELSQPTLFITPASASASGNCGISIITIADNDPTVTITAGNNVVAGNPATFTVTRNASQASPLTVTLNVSESSGGTIGNYVASTNEGQGISVNIPANQTTFVHSVPTMLDNRADRTDSILTVEVVNMSGSVTNTSGYYARKDNVATLSIMPKPAAIFIRTKVFLEGPLQ